MVRVFGQGSFRNNCYGVECDAIGTYYVSDIVGHSISVFDINGGIRKRFGNLGEKLNNFNQPVALAINDQNKLFISDSQNHCVKVKKKLTVVFVMRTLIKLRINQLMKQCESFLI